MSSEVTFTLEEIRRARVLEDLIARQLSRQEAADILAISLRQLSRILAAYIRDGIEGVRSKKRGKASNNRIPKSVIDEVIECYRVNLRGYGPKQAAEVLSAEYGHKISRERLRNALIQVGLWSVGLKPSMRSRTSRKREECVGNLLQVDGSTHAWLDSEGTQCLLVFIDDATSRVMRLAMVPCECADAYLTHFKAYIERCGRPIRVYADRHAALFRRGKRSGQLVPDFTSDLARALQELEIVVVPSFSAEGRGRVERVHRTLQDWLPKFLKRRNAQTIEEANALLAEFVHAHNERFATPPANREDRHRDLPPEVNLDLIMSRQYVRRVSRTGLLSFGGDTYLVLDQGNSEPRAGRKLTVHLHPDGRVTLTSNGNVVPHRLFEKRRGGQA